MRYITAAGVKGEFYLKLEQLMALWADKLSIEFDSNSAVEDYAWLGTPGGLKEVKGEKKAETPAEYFYQLRNREFEGGLNIPRKDIERDKTNQIMAQVGDFGTRCAGHWMELLSALQLAGDGTSLGTCYDGKNFFSATHGERKSGTQKNLLTSSTISELSIVLKTAPTPAEAIKAILGVITHMLAIKDDQGYPMNSNAREFLVMTAPALWKWLVPAISNATISSGDTNTIMSLKADGFNISLTANPLLDYTEEFDVYRTDAPLKPFIRQSEIPLEIDVLGPGSEHYRLNNQMKVGGYTRRAVGYGRWQYAAHATLATT